MSLGHIDVVPGPDEIFTPTITGERLKGRGSFDMKTGIAVSLALLSWVKKENKDVNMGVVFVDLISEGQRASGMLPWEGKSAIDCMLATIHKLREYFPYFDIDKKETHA